MKYIALLRGINVGGKNKISMSDLKEGFENAGFRNTRTYINSGNVIFDSGKKAYQNITIRNANTTKKLLELASQS